MIVVTVIYPKTSQSRFDLDYYLQKHIPLVRARFTGMGIEDIHLMRGTSGLDGGRPGFEVIAALHFSSPQAMQAALAKHGQEIMGDIPNFSDVQLLMQVNEPL